MASSNGKTKQQEGVELSAAPLPTLSFWSPSALFLPWLSAINFVPFPISLPHSPVLCWEAMFSLLPDLGEDFLFLEFPHLPPLAPWQHSMVPTAWSLPCLSLLFLPLPRPVWTLPCLRVHLSYYHFQVLSCGATPCPTSLNSPCACSLDLPCFSLIGDMFPSNSSRADVLPHDLCVLQILPLHSHEIFVWISCLF